MNITAHEFRKNELARQRQDSYLGLTQQAIQPEWYHIAESQRVAKSCSASKTHHGRGSATTQSNLK